MSLKKKFLSFKSCILYYKLPSINSDLIRFDFNNFSNFIMINLCQLIDLKNRSVDIMNSLLQLGWLVSA